MCRKPPRGHVAAFVAVTACSNPSILPQGRVMRLCGPCRCYRQNCAVPTTLARTSSSRRDSHDRKPSSLPDRQNSGRDAAEKSSRDRSCCGRTFGRQRIDVDAGRQSPSRQRSSRAAAARSANGTSRRSRRPRGRFAAACCRRRPGRSIQAGNQRVQHVGQSIEHRRVAVARTTAHGSAGISHTSCGCQLAKGQNATKPSRSRTIRLPADRSCSTSRQ